MAGAQAEAQLRQWKLEGMGGSSGPQTPRFHTSEMTSGCCLSPPAFDDLFRQPGHSHTRVPKADGADGTLPRLCRRSNKHISKSVFIQLHPILHRLCKNRWCCFNATEACKRQAEGQRRWALLPWASWPTLRGHCPGCLLGPSCHQTPPTPTFSDRGPPAGLCHLPLGPSGQAPSQSRPGSESCPGSL